MSIDLTPEVVLGLGIALALLVGTLLFAYYYFVFLSQAPVALKPNEFQSWPLMDKKKVSHDSYIYTFEFPRCDMQLGLPIGQHITLGFYEKETDRFHQRSYTPISGNDTLGRVLFLIKVYRSNVHPKFPNGGKVSQYIDSLEIGQTIQVKGPKGHLEYMKRGNFKIQPPNPRKPIQQRRGIKHIGMICGGTGITPMLQLLETIFRKENDGNNNTNITVKMIYANQTEEDILCRTELQALARDFPKQFTLHYTLDRPPPKDWTGSKGFVTKEMIATHLFDKPSPTTQIFMCGPPPMVKFACIDNLKALGFTENDWFAF